jgi:hypothetical protein
LDELNQYIANGATYLAAVDFDQITNLLLEKCETLNQTDQFIIFDLQTCNLNNLAN